MALTPPRQDGIEPALRQALTHHQAGRMDQAQALLRRILKRTPSHARANHLMGAIQFHKGNAEQALYYFDRAIATNPTSAVSHQARGNMLQLLDRLDEAAQAQRRALDIDPTSYLAHNSLGLVLMKLSDYDGAEASFRRAMAVGPNKPEAVGNLGLVMLNSGRANEAAQVLEKATRAHRDHPGLHHQYVCVLSYATNVTPEQALDAHRQYGQILQRLSPTPTRDFPNAPDPDRRLRVGYVSGDFRLHSVAYFMDAPIRLHDREAFEVCCYSTTHYPDAITERFREMADLWRDYQRLDDEGLIEQILADRIDILVDLSGHSSGNRLGVMHARPAPVQATYCGYVHSTGLAAVDYRIVDNLTDPDDEPDQAVETLVRLPRCFLCYTPGGYAPEPVPPPCLAGGRVTFGSFNNLQKIHEETIQLWSRIVHDVPGSRLLIKNTALSDKSLAERYRQRFASAGLTGDSLELMGRVESTAEHLSLYNRVDIALDTHPYHGTTTTCEAMWMGVPVVTLRGVVHAGRVGVSLLTQVGLDDLIASTPDEYARIAGDLARDPERLARIRGGLRETMRTSPLCDGPGFVRELEQAYRSMWRTWCDQHPGSPS